jgi:hypothetical protein
MASLANKTTLDETTDESTALASHSGVLYLAWKGAGNENLNVALSEDNGATFPTKATYGETTDRAPALASLPSGPLAIAWKGAGNQNLNVATVPLFVGGSGGDQLADKNTFPETSDEAPSLDRFGVGPALGWKGAGNDNLNVAHLDGTATIAAKATYGESSDSTPAIAVIGAELWIAWRDPIGGTVLAAPTAFQLGTEHDTLGRIEVVELGDASPAQSTSRGPALGNHDDHAVVAFKGDGNDNLNIWRKTEAVTISSNWQGNPLEDTTDRSPALASHNGQLFMAWKGSGNENINVARVNL